MKNDTKRSVPVRHEHIACLKRLHRKWSLKLQHATRLDPEFAFHLAESLEDLEHLIRQLETGDSAHR